MLTGVKSKGIPMKDVLGTLPVDTPTSIYWGDEMKLHVFKYMSRCDINTNMDREEMSTSQDSSDSICTTATNLTKTKDVYKV